MSPLASLSPSSSLKRRRFVLMHNNRSGSRMQTLDEDRDHDHEKDTPYSNDCYDDIWNGKTIMGIIHNHDAYHHYNVHF